MKKILMTALYTALFLVTAITLISTSAFAAPMPGTSTSKLVSPKLGIYRSPLGFELEAGGTGWLHSEVPKNSKFIATMYRAPARSGKASTGTLTVRVDDLEKEIPLEKYVEGWKKEYPKYGFDVIASKPFTQNKQRGYVLDLINRDNKKQLRQVVFMKKQHAVIMTCRDQTEQFKQSLKDCNQIIRTFKWQ